MVIPAYNPGGRLLDLAGEMRALFDPEIVVVDDGSGSASAPVFEALAAGGSAVLRHERNRGKGAALKTAAAYIAAAYPGARGFVTADADFQHLPEDIARVARALEANPGSLILGVRDFDARGVPFKSRWGNRITRGVFRLASGVSCADTQTGLRGIPAAFAAECAAVSGERFEYETNVLLAAAAKNVPFVEIPIQTVYDDGNRATNFRALRDSALIYLSILKSPNMRRLFAPLKFGCSSALCSALDLGLFSLVLALLPGLSASGILAATVTARGASGLCNFLLNKCWVFAGKARGGRSAAQGAAFKYALLFCGQMAVSWLLVSLLSPLPAAITLIKAFVDTALFLTSYHIQKEYIFPAAFERKAGRTYRHGRAFAYGNRGAAHGNAL